MEEGKGRHTNGRTKSQTVLKPTLINTGKYNKVTKTVSVGILSITTEMSPNNSNDKELTSQAVHKKYHI